MLKQASNKHINDKTTEKHFKMPCAVSKDVLDDNSRRNIIPPSNGNIGIKLIKNIAKLILKKKSYLKYIPINANIPLSNGPDKYKIISSDMEYINLFFYFKFAPNGDNTNASALRPINFAAIKCANS